MAISDLYTEDFHAWCFEQVGVMESCSKMSDLDLEHVIEEIRGMGNQQQQTLESYLVVLFKHLLKWVYQPERRGNSWKLSIEHSRVRVDKLMRKNPSLKHHYDEIVGDAYESARYECAEEAGIEIDSLPVDMPFELDKAREAGWLPSSF